MSPVYSFHAGDSPLLISVPHDGREVPDAIAAHMTDAGRSLVDTDWHVARLYDFARELGASLLVANVSRYVVDLNRSADDTALYAGRQQTGLFPTRTFDGRALFSNSVPIAPDERLRRFWHPYHDKLDATLASLREQHGFALLWDAHSIPSRVPTLFDGELPVFSIGTWDGRSCAATIEKAIADVAGGSPYDAVLNGRFKGGHITRHYGDPGAGVHAVQLELAQRA